MYKLSSVMYKLYRYIRKNMKKKYRLYYLIELCFMSGYMVVIALVELVSICYQGGMLCVAMEVGVAKDIDYYMRVVAENEGATDKEIADKEGINETWVHYLKGSNAFMAGVAALKVRGHKCNG